jgi:hypothetical protein
MLHTGADGRVHDGHCGGHSCTRCGCGGMRSGCGYHDMSVCIHTSVYMCPHTATYMSTYCYICVRILLHMSPHTASGRLQGAIYVSSYYYICVRILLYMCPHTSKYVSAYCQRAPARRDMSHTHTHTHSPMSFSEIHT